MSKYILTPLMTNKYVDRSLNFIANKIASKLIYCNKISESASYTFKGLLEASKLFIKESDVIWKSALERSRRRGSTPLSNRFIALLLFVKNFFFSILCFDFVKNKQVVLLATSEPYIESILLRLIGRYTNTRTISYTTREYLAFVVEPNEFWPTVIDFEFIISNMNNKFLRVSASPMNFEYTTGSSILVGKSKKNNLDEVELECNSVFIFCHDFLDAPSLFGYGIYNDLQTWLIETIAILIENNIKFYIKAHPNQIERSSQIFKELTKKLGVEKNIINHHNETIFQSQPSLIVTNHGSISLEAAVRGVQVSVTGPCVASLGGVLLPWKSKFDYYKGLVDIRGVKVDQKLALRLAASLKYKQYKFKYNVPTIYSLNSPFGFDCKNNEQLMSACLNSIEYDKWQYDQLNSILSNPNHLVEFNQLFSPL
jgi:hypothetical protein